ncbi:hypothetical protein ACM43_24325 [Bradyrhizobium sp. CCBAU 45321]|nr:hypothetical protein [Bradyrhizobium sp. CCBAU 45321]
MTGILLIAGPIQSRLPNGLIIRRIVALAAGFRITLSTRLTRRVKQEHDAIIAERTIDKVPLDIRNIGNPLPFSVILEAT